MTHKTWADAVEQIHSQFSYTDQDTSASWEAAGIITSDGLAPDWALALHVAQKATWGMEIVATCNGVTFHSMIFVRDPYTATVTRP